MNFVIYSYTFQPQPDVTVDAGDSAVAPENNCRVLQKFNRSRVLKKAQNFLRTPRKPERALAQRYSHVTQEVRGEHLLN